MSLWGADSNVVVIKKTASLYACICGILSCLELLSSLITLGKKVFYVGIKLIICVYINVLKVQDNKFTWY